MRTKILTAALTLMLVLPALCVMAGAPPPPPPLDQAEAPIDSGALVLLIAATIYGYKQLKSEEKETV